VPILGWILSAATLRRLIVCSQNCDFLYVPPEEWYQYGFEERYGCCPYANPDEAGWQPYSCGDAWWNRKRPLGVPRGAR
jgi:hypothetical protein